VAKQQMCEFLIQVRKTFIFDLVLLLHNICNLQVRKVFHYPTILPALSGFKSRAGKSGCLDCHSSLALDYNIYHPVAIRPYPRTHVWSYSSVLKDSSWGCFIAEGSYKSPPSTVVGPLSWDIPSFPLTYVGLVF